MTRLSGEQRRRGAPRRSGSRSGQLEDVERTLIGLSRSLPHVDVGCPACRGTARRSIFVRSGFRVAECASCRTLYVTPRPTEDALVGVYRTHPELADFGNDACLNAGGDNLAETRYRLRRVLDVRESGRLLDVGCGRGEFVTAAQAHFKSQGVDVSLRQETSTREGCTLISRLEEAGFDADTFDVVTLVEVLEHLFDPRRTLGEIHRIMKPRGILLLQTGDADSLIARLAPQKWGYVRPPIHLNCFSRDGLVQLASDAGFRVVGAHSFGRAPQRLRGSRLLANPEILRPALDLAARVGLIGQMYLMAKARPG